MQNNLYTTELAGQSWDKDKRYEMVIITKWKDRTDKSSAEGHKVYYFNPDFDLILIYLQSRLKMRIGVKRFMKTIQSIQDLKLKAR